MSVDKHTLEVLRRERDHYMKAHADLPALLQKHPEELRESFKAGYMNGMFLSFAEVVSIHLFDESRHGVPLSELEESK